MSAVPWFGVEPSALAAFLLDKLGGSQHHCARNILEQELCGEYLLDHVDDKILFAEALSNVGVLEEWRIDLIWRHFDRRRSHMTAAKHASRSKRITDQQTISAKAASSSGRTLSTSSSISSNGCTSLAEAAAVTAITTTAGAAEALSSSEAAAAATAVVYEDVTTNKETSTSSSPPIRRKTHRGK